MIGTSFCFILFLVEFRMFGAHFLPNETCFEKTIGTEQLNKFIKEKNKDGTRKRERRKWGIGCSPPRAKNSTTWLRFDGTKFGVIYIYIHQKVYIQLNT